MFFLFFFNDTATTEIYTLSLHDALPISPPSDTGRSQTGSSNPSTAVTRSPSAGRCGAAGSLRAGRRCPSPRSEEHTSELQSRPHLVCRLLLEKKKKLNEYCGRCQSHALS